MPRFSFIATGVVLASSEDYASSDVGAVLVKDHRITLTRVTTVKDMALCGGSEEPATHVEALSDANAPYYHGRCRSCGIMVPLLSAGNFEVIKHFAPSNYSRVSEPKESVVGNNDPLQGRA